MLKKNTYTALMATFFCWPLLALGVENQREEPSNNWVFEAPSTYTKDEFLSVGLSGDGNPVQSPIIVSDGMVFFSTYEGALYAVDEHDGSLKWSTDIFDETGRNIALYENLVFFGEGVVTDSSRPYGSKIVALNKRTGEEVWSFTADDFSGIWGITTHAGNVIFSTGSEIYAFDALSGEERWQFSPVDFWGGLSSKNGLVYFQERSTDVYALDVASGEVVFSYKSDVEADYNPGGAAIALHEENLIFTSGTREEPFIYSYSIDGTENWKTPLDGISLSSIAVDECCVFLSTENGQESSFHSLDVNSGQHIWSRDNEGFVRHAFLVRDDKVYFSNKSRAISIHKEDGQLAWSSGIEGVIFTPIVSSSNGLLFGTFEGAVYSIKEP